MLFISIPLLTLSQVTVYQKLIGNPLAVDSAYIIHSVYKDLEGNIHLIGLNQLQDANHYPVSLEIQLDSVGDITQELTYGYNGGAGSAVQNVCNYNNNSYLILGSFIQSFQNGCIAILITDSVGQVTHAKCLAQTDSSEKIYTNFLIKSSDVFYSGWVYRQNSVSQLNEILLVKIDTALNITWAKHYNSGYTDEADGICATSDGGVIAYGLRQDSSQALSNFVDGFIIKVDSSGAVVWANTYDSGTNFNSLNSMVLLNDGGYIVSFYAQLLNGQDMSGLMRLNSQGIILWTKGYQAGFDNYFLALDTTTDGGFVAGGALFNGSDDAFIMKFDSLGNPQWNYVYQNYAGQIHSVYQMADKGYLSVGYSSLTNNHGTAYPTIIKTDSMGYVGCGEISFPVTVFNNVLTQGTHAFTDSAVGIFTYPVSLVSAPIRISDSTQCGGTVGIKQNLISNTDIIMYPNPASDNITIKNICNKTNKMQVELTDIYGRTMFSQNLSIDNGSLRLNLTTIKAGVYNLNLFDNTRLTTSKKLVIIK